MSAYMVDDRHIDFLVSAAAIVGTMGVFDEDTTGRMLWRENLRSLETRYGGGAPDDDAVVAYRWRPVTTLGYCGGFPLADCVQVLKAIAGYEYQACEHGDWRESEAFRFCERLRHEMIARLPGYRDAAWEITEAVAPVGAAGGPVSIMGMVGGAK